MALDARWFQIVILGMILHITNTCIIGFCGDMGMKSEPDWGSCLFTFATLNLLTTQNLCPSVIGDLNKVVGRLFEVGASIFIADVTLVTVWQPLIKIIAAIPPFLGSVVQCLSTAFCLAETAPVVWLLSILSAECETSATVTILIVALLMALYSVQSSDFISSLKSLLDEKNDVPPVPNPEEETRKSRLRNRSRSRSRVRRCGSVDCFGSGD